MSVDDSVLTAEMLKRMAERLSETTTELLPRLRMDWVNWYFYKPYFDNRDEWQRMLSAIEQRIKEVSESNSNGDGVVGVDGDIRSVVGDAG